jgi:hypothetical protein
MAQKRVRCPFCAKRFDVTGIEPGTRLRCGGCTAILTVPSVPAAGSAGARRLRLGPALCLAAAAALLSGGGALLLNGPAPALPSPVTARAAVRKAPPPEEPAAGPAETPFLDDPVGRAKNEILREFGSQILFTEQVKPYLVALERTERSVDPDVLREYASRLETLHLAFRRDFAERLGLAPVEGVLPVVVLRSRESFDRYCEARDKKRMAPAIKGFYEYGRRRVVTYHEFAAPYELLLHEGAHQLIHHYTLQRTEGRRVPSAYWFQEGVGTYFESFRRRVDGEIALDAGGHSLRLPALRQALAAEGRKDFIPLSMLVGMTVDEFWDWFERGMMSEPAEVTRKAQIYYAETWAFVHFLRQSGPRMRKIFEDYARLELEGAAGKAAFEALVRDELGVDLPQLEDQFVRYIRDLK